MNTDQGFRLRRLKISGHPILREVDITFCDDNIDTHTVYTTGIIGSNGTGKSHLMSAIATVFTEIHRARKKEIGNRKFSFTVYYECCGDTYCVTNSRKSEGYLVFDIPGNQSQYIAATRNGLEIRLEDVLLPERVIASTMTVTDKFLARTDDFYRYKGIRNERLVSTTGTRTIIRKTIDSLMNCMATKSAFQKELRILLNNLELEEHLNVSYGMRYKELFLKPEIDADGIRDIFDNWEKHFPSRKTAPWGYNNYIRGLRENEEALSEAARFLSEKARGSFGDAMVAEYDLMHDALLFQRDAEALKTLTQLDLVTFPSINVVKKGTAFGLEDSSSGETHLLCQFIGIMADIRHNSLILIDEPENSSHPDWQMNYVGWLKDIFRDYYNCHFVIATHSPLILVNMKASESTIVRLKRDEKNRIKDEGGMINGCFSWTVDEVLEDVMGMKQSRTSEYMKAMNDFEKALDEDSKEKASNAYQRLVTLIKPGNELAEMLRIQMIGIGD